MSQINQLSSTETISGGDLLALWKTNNGDTRKASITLLMEYIQANFVDQDSIYAKADTFADLRALSTTTLRIVTALGKTTINDSFGDTFYWDATSAEVDNDLTIIQPTGITTGRWRRLDDSKPVTVDTITDLLSYEGTVLKAIEIRGYSTLNDGGEGTFDWDSTKDKATADAGRVIDPDETLANQGDGTGTGCWVRRTDTVYDPRHYGAKLDGTTDDFDAVRLALFAIWDAGGGTLSLSGPCGISKRLNFDTYDFMPSDPLGASGDGKSISQIGYDEENVPVIKVIGTTAQHAPNNGSPVNPESAGFFWIGTLSDDMIKISGNVNGSWRGSLHFESLTIEGGDNLTLTSTTAAKDGIWIAQRCNKGCIFKDLLITKCKSAGFRYGDGSTSSNNIFSNYHENIKSIYNGKGIHIKGNDQTFMQCSAESNKLHGVVLTKMNNNNRWIGGAIQFNSVHQLVIEGNSNQNSFQDVYFEGQNENTVGAITSAGNSFIYFDGTDGDMVSTKINGCRFVFGNSNSAYDEDYIVDLGAGPNLCYGFEFVDNSINTDNVTIISNTAGGEVPIGGIYYNNYFSGALAVVEFTDQTLKDTFQFAMNKNQSGLIYETGSFTMTGVGFDASTTVTAYYTRIGDLVNISMPLDLSGTSNAVTFTITGMPSNIRPKTSTKYIAVLWASDNANNIDTARALIDTGGVITMFTNAGASSNTAWTATGTKRLRSNEFAYGIEG